MDIKLYKSPWRAIKLILLSSIFVCIGVMMLNSSDTLRWITWTFTIFFGLGYPVGIFHLLDRRPQIIINEIGIFDRTTYQDFINWNVIQHAYPIDISGQKFVSLVVDEKYEPSFRKGKVAKSASRLSKAIGAQELNISLGQIKIDEVKLTEFIMTMISMKPEEREGKLKQKLLS